MVARASVALALVSLVVAGTAGAARRGDAYYPCARGKDLHFRAADKTRLVGHRFGRGSTAVVLAHQSDGNVCQWAPYARRLAALGFTAIAFDMRGHGDSQSRRYPASQRYGADVAAAVKVARSLGAKKVFLVGASLGGAAVIVAGANVRPLVQGVVDLSGPAAFGAGLDARPAARRLQVPVRYVVAENDDGFVDDTRTLYGLTAVQDKQLKVVPGSGHGVQLLADSAEVRALVEDFIRSR